MTEVRLEDCKTSFWETDGGNLIASVTSSIASALLILRAGFQPGDDWEILERNSPMWNWFHQCIFRNHRADPVEAERIAALPPLPEAFFVGEERPAEYFHTPREPIPASKYPEVRNCIQATGDSSIPIHVVLLEDLYETKLGDGKFHDLHSVWLLESECRAAVVQIQKEEWHRAHVRRMTIAIIGENVEIPDFKLELFDTEGVETIVDRLEERLAKKPGVAKSAANGVHARAG